MRRISPALPAGLLLGVLFFLAVLPAGGGPKGLPDAVARAHTVFLENETGFVELQYTLILELNKWGRFDIAERREKADLVMRLESGSHARAVPEGQFPTRGGMNAFTESEIPRGYTRIALLDPKSNTLLWSDTHKTEGAKVKNGHLLDGLREAFDSYDKGRR